MYKAENPISLQKIVTAANVAKHLDMDDVKAIGMRVLEAFNADDNSRSARLAKIVAAEKAAMMLCEEKTFPWEGAANVKMPIVQLACLQFHSRAFPTIVSTPDLVRCEVDIDDPEGEYAAKAKRVSKHMSFQLMRKIPSWMTEQDRLLLMLPVIGCAIKKVFFDQVGNKPESVLIRPSQFVIDYHAKDIATAERASHWYPISLNTIISRIRQGVFLEDEEKPYDSDTYAASLAAGTHTDEVTDTKDAKQGVEQNQFDGTPHAIEMHCWLDLDGDNYCEPYIVTIDKDTGWVWRIRARFDSTDITWKDPAKPFDSAVIDIKPEVCFIKYPFVPSPDGGFYDQGFYDLLGPVNETVDSLINQMLDAGTMGLAGGGFLGKGARIKGGDYRFKPFEWKRLESIAQRLSDVVMPLQTPEPSAVLLQLLSMLIEYSERVAGSTESMTGIAPGQNTPAETTRNVMEQGLKIYSAIYLRIYLAHVEEYRALYRQNALYLKTDKEPYVQAGDYMLDDFSVGPTADPAVVSDAMRIQQVSALVNAKATAGIPYDGGVIGLMLAEALKVRNPQRLFPKEAPQPQPDATKLAVAQISADQREKEGQRVHTREMLRIIQTELPKVQAEVAALESKATEHQATAVFKTAEAKAALDGSQIAKSATELDAHRLRYDTLLKVVELLQTLTENNSEDDTSKQSSTTGGSGAARGVAIPSLNESLSGPGPVAAGIRQGAIEQGGLADVGNPTTRFDGVDSAS